MTTALVLVWTGIIMTAMIMREMGKAMAMVKAMTMVKAGIIMVMMIMMMEIMAMIRDMEIMAMIRDMEIMAMPTEGPIPPTTILTADIMELTPQTLNDAVGKTNIL